METTTNGQVQVLDKSHVSDAFSMQGFDHAQRIAVMLADSTLVPDVYKGKPSNCLIALEMANRMGASPLMVMQHLHIIKGKPGFSSPFIIASINTCGRFDRLKFTQSGEGENYGYEAWTKDKHGEVLTGPKVDWKMVKLEGWLAKDGSKWKTMPELMFRYRAAAFWCRLHAPELLMGMQTEEEVLDVMADVVEENPKDKEAERIELLIKDARNLQDLQAIRDHIKPGQQELFQERVRDLSID